MWRYAENWNYDISTLSLTLPVKFDSHLVGIVRVTDHIPQAEVCLAVKVMVKVGVRDLIPVQDQSLSGHELHQAFYQQTHQQLLKYGYSKKTFGGQI